MNSDNMITPPSPPLIFVDDTDDNLEIYRLLFGDSKFPTYFYLSGKEAIAGIKSLNPQVLVLVLDIMMPDLDGYEVLDILREELKSTKMKVIIASGRALQSDIDFGKNAGCDLYITKPFSLKELQKQVLDIYSEACMLTQESSSSEEPPQVIG